MVERNGANECGCLVAAELRCIIQVVSFITAAALAIPRGLLVDGMGQRLHNANELLRIIWILP